MVSFIRPQLELIIFKYMLEGLFSLPRKSKLKAKIRIPGHLATLGGLRAATDKFSKDYLDTIYNSIHLIRRFIMGINDKFFV